MIEIRIHGRGGQGGVTLAKILAAAEHREGRSVQAFGVYAAERSGAPVQAFLRCDDEPIHNPNQIYEPDHLVVLDPTLISPTILSGLKPGGWILLNCEKSPEHYAGQERVAAFRIATVDATSIAVKHGLGSRTVPIVNTALAGAAARLLGMNMESVLAAFEDFGFHGGNELAAREAWDAVRIQQQDPQPGEPHPPLQPHTRQPGLIGGNTGAPPAIHTGQWANQRPIRRKRHAALQLRLPGGQRCTGLPRCAERRGRRRCARASCCETIAAAVGLRPGLPGFCMLQCNRSQLEGPVNVRALERYVGDHGDGPGDGRGPPIRAGCGGRRRPGWSVRRLSPGPPGLPRHSDSKPAPNSVD